MWRTAATVPLAIIGDVVRVRAMLQEVTKQLFDREVITVDLWVRPDEEIVGGLRRRPTKRSLVLVVSHGDVERHRVRPPVRHLPPSVVSHSPRTAVGYEPIDGTGWYIYGTG